MISIRGVGAHDATDHAATGDDFVVGARARCHGHRFGDATHAQAAVRLLHRAVSNRQLALDGAESRQRELQTVVAGIPLEHVMPLRIRRRLNLNRVVRVEKRHRCAGQRRPGGITQETRDDALDRLQRRRVRLRRREECFGQRHDGPACVVRLRNVLNERLRRARDERELYVRPVFAHRVVDDRPSLKQRRHARLRREHESIGRFPDRDLADVADEDPPRPRPRCGDHHASNVAIAAGRDQRKIARQLLSKGALADVNTDIGSEHECADAPFIGHERQLVDGFNGVSLRSLAPLHAEQSAGDDRRGASNVDARAAQRVVDVERIRVGAERQSQRRQALVERRGRVVVDVDDVPGVEIESGQRLQDVIELAAGELHGHIR